MKKLKLSKKKKPDNESAVKYDIDGNLICLPPEKRRNANGWKAPKNMPDKVVELVLAGKICGALLRNGRFCMSTHVVPNGTNLPPYRCRRHPLGLAISELRGPAPILGRKQLTHGFYAGILLPGEQEVVNDFLDVDDLDAEISLVKVRLRRAVFAESEQEEAVLAGTVDKNGWFEVETTEESGYSDEGGSYQKRIQRRKLVDWGRKIEVLISQLARLQATKADLNKDTETEEERQERVRQTLADITSVVKKGEVLQ